MLGSVVTDQRGVLDDMLADIADRLQAEGIRLAGAIQTNDEPKPGARCDMNLRILGAAQSVCISQQLGPHATGCRLDPGALEHAVAHVEQSLATGPQLLIVNKFGKAEMDGRGFRPVIGQALAAGIPVLTAVGRGGLPGFDSFVEGFGLRLPFDSGAALDWCRNAIAEAALDGPAA